MEDTNPEITVTTKLTINGKPFDPMNPVQIKVEKHILGLPVGDFGLEGVPVWLVRVETIGTEWLERYTDYGELEAFLKGVQAGCAALGRPIFLPLDIPR